MGEVPSRWGSRAIALYPPRTVARFSRPRRVATASLLVLFGAAACTSTQEVVADPLPEPREQGGALGTPVDHWGTEVNLLNIEAFDQSVSAFPRLRVTVRSENVTDIMARNPRHRALV